jgi:hypothetical protein
MKIENYEDELMFESCKSFCLQAKSVKGVEMNNV